MTRNTGCPRVLLIGELANPRYRSVPQVGWSHAKALREVADVHLVTKDANRENIAAAGWGEGEDFTALEMGDVSGPIERVAELLRGGAGRGWTTVMALSLLTYGVFERRLWRRFEDDLRAGRFDLVHRLTPLSPSLPSLIAPRCRKIGVPFMLGPLNGGLPWPKEFPSLRHEEREWLSYVREAYRLVPGYAATRRAASAIVVGSVATMQDMPAWAHDKCIYIPENGVSEDRFSVERTRRATLPLRLIFIGRLVPMKGVDMLLRAAAPFLREGKAELEILGDGPQRGALEGLVAALGVGDRVTFSGFVPVEDVQHHLARSDVFVFPSVREFGGAVVIEAMTMGLAPVVVGYGGPGEHVDPRCGVAVPLGPPEAIEAGFRAALSDMVADPGLVDRFGACAKRRAETFYTWQAKAAQMREVYDWVLGRRPDRPDFGMPYGASGASSLGVSTGALVGEP